MPFYSASKQLRLPQLTKRKRIHSFCIVSVGIVLTAFMCAAPAQAGMLDGIDIDELGSVDPSNLMKTFKEVVQGTHRFSGSEKLLYYEKDQGRTPKEARDLFKRGLEAHFKHQEKEALDLYNQAIKVAPDYLPLQLEKAALLADMRKQPESIKLCDQMLAQKPNYIPALHLRAVCFSEVSEPQKSIEDWTKALTYDPRDVTSLQERAKLFAKLGRQADATRDMEHADTLVLPEKLGVLVAEGRSDDALKLADAAIKKNPANLQFAIAKVGLLEQLHRSDDVVKECHHMAAQHPELAAPMFYFSGKAQLKVNKPAEAAHDFTSAMKAAAKHPTFPKMDSPWASKLFNDVQHSVLLERAAAYVQMKNYDKALADCSAFIKSNATNTAGYIRRAETYEAAGRLKESLKDYKKALALAPSNTRVQNRIADLKETMSGGKHSTSHSSTDKPKLPFAKDPL